MAKIARKHQKVFSSSSSDNGQFGSAALGTKVLSSDIETLQNLAAYLNGWNSATISASKLPPLEEQNCLHYINTYQLAYLMQEGIAEWHTTTEYHQNSLCKVGANVYTSNTDTNAGNDPDTDRTNWSLYSFNVYREESSSYVITNIDAVGLLGMITGASDKTATLPAVADNANREITFKKIDSGLGNLIIDTPGGETIDGAATLEVKNQYEAVTLVPDGSNWHIKGHQERLVVARAKDSAANSLTTGVGPYMMAFLTTDHDTLSGFTHQAFDSTPTQAATEGTIYTAVDEGYYQINAQVSFGNVAWGANTFAVVYIYVNGTIISNKADTVGGATTVAQDVNISSTVFLSKGAVVQIGMLQTSGSPLTIGTSDQKSFVDIIKVR